MLKNLTLQIKSKLEQYLPLYTNKLTVNILITNITRIGNELTITTANPHLLNANQLIHLSNILTAIEISSISIDTGIATINTLNDNQLVLNTKYHPKISIYTADANWNKEFNVYTIPAYNQVLVETGNLTTPTDPAFIVFNYRTGFNGVQVVKEVVDANTFKIEIPTTPQGINNPIITPNTLLRKLNQSIIATDRHEKQLSELKLKDTQMAVIFSYVNSTVDDPERRNFLQENKSYRSVIIQEMIFDIVVNATQDYNNINGRHEAETVLFGVIDIFTNFKFYIKDPSIPITVIALTNYFTDNSNDARLILRANFEFSYEYRVEDITELEDILPFRELCIDTYNEEEQEVFKDNLIDYKTVEF